MSVPPLSTQLGGVLDWYNNGSLVVFNLDPTVSSDDLRQVVEPFAMKWCCWRSHEGDDRDTLCHLVRWPRTTDISAEQQQITVRHLCNHLATTLRLICSSTNRNNKGFFVLFSFCCFVLII